MEPWQEDAKSITNLKDLDIENDLVITIPIKKFIDRKKLRSRDRMFFVTSTKGFGKTLFVMYKRYLYETIHEKEWGGDDIIMLEEDMNREIILPSGEIVERDKIDVSYDSGKIGILVHPVNWEKIWSMSIYLTAIKNFYDKDMENLDGIIKREIPHKDQGEVNELISNSYRKLYLNLEHILGLSHADIGSVLE